MAIYQMGDDAPMLGERAWVAEGATVIGRVALGAGSSVWTGAVLRGDNEWITLGARCNVQEGAVLHTDMGFPLGIGAGCTIGHKAMLHGCTIGDNSLIGMGAIILNGAVIGRDCLIGAGALVTERKTIPDGSLVMGAPARVVRPLDAAAIDRLRLSARSYQDNARRFAAGLREV
jgi:carbonic anhydrase/acetyltransferase-like protein (isoleucine patch superfamily)